MQHRFFAFWLAFAFLIFWGSHSALPAWAETYHGKVVDAKTGEPLEGAVVVVVWYKRPIITMDNPGYFHDAKEVLTDANGQFSVDGSPAIDWNPFTSVLREPHIAIFKPGYGPFPSGHVRDTPIEQIKKALLVKDGTVIKLPRLETEQEMKKYTIPGDMWISTVVPYERIPNIMKLINIQRKNLGLQPFGGPSH